MGCQDRRVAVAYRIQIIILLTILLIIILNKFKGILALYLY
jgi:hypothetical protein